MKRIIIVLVSALIALASYAEKASSVQPVEGELSFGLAYPIQNYYDGERQISPDISVALRYNIPNSRLDVGASLNVTTTVYKFPTPDGGAMRAQSNRGINYLLSLNYNFGQGQCLNPFAGLAWGYSNERPLVYIPHDNAGRSFILRPQAGVELWSHLRCGVFFDIAKIGYNNAGVSIGFVLGGRPRTNSEH